MDLKTRILMTLLEGPLPQSMIQVRSAGKGSKRTSPRIMAKTLDILQQEKCITFENKKTWCRGQKKIYKITEKGTGRLIEDMGKELPAVTDIFERFLELSSFIMGSQSFRQRWVEGLHQSIQNQDSTEVVRHVFSSLDECIQKIHELKLDLGIVSLLEPLRKYTDSPWIDAKTILENSVLCFDHSARGRDENDLPFCYLPRKGFKAMLERASSKEKGFLARSSPTVSSQVARRV